MRRTSSPFKDLNGAGGAHDHANLLCLLPHSSLSFSHRALAIDALHLLAAGLFSGSSAARDITFPPVSGFQQVLNYGGGIDVTTGSAFAGLTTYANLPYVHCLAGEGHQVEKFDIAILGAPFDTVSAVSSFHEDVIHVWEDLLRAF